MKQLLVLAGVGLAIAAAPVTAQPRHVSHDRQGTYGRHCPPGLARKHNGCIAPGKARKLSRGQRYQSSYRYRTYSYNSIPSDLRRRYDLDRRNRYYYNNGYLYGVDPRTNVVEQVIQALLR